MKMCVINNIFLSSGSARFGGFRSADILVSSAFDHSAATLAFCSVLTVRRPGRAGSGGRTGRAGRVGRAAEGRACCFARSCRVADGGAPSGSGGLAGRRMEGPAAVLDGGGGVSGGMAGLAVSDGRVGQLSRRTADGPGGVGDLLCRMRAVGACPCPCPCPCLPANRMSAAEKRRRNLSLPARKRIFEGH